MLNPEAVCDTYAVLQEGVYYAFGGKVANEFVVCGGYTDVGTSKNCYKVGETAPIVELFQPRAVGSSVVLANNTLLLLGEFNSLDCLPIFAPSKFTLIIAVFRRISIKRYDQVN